MTSPRRTPALSAPLPRSTEYTSGGSLKYNAPELSSTRISQLPEHINPKPKEPRGRGWIATAARGVTPGASLGADSAEGGGVGVRAHWPVGGATPTGLEGA